MRILYINHYAGSPKYGMEYRPYYLALHWTKKGHQVSIITASYSHVRNIQPSPSGYTTEELIDGIRYIWFKTPSYKGNTMRRVINIFSFILGLYLKRRLLIEWRPDIIIASSTYPLDIFPAYKIARDCNAKLVFEVHDLWPLSPIELGGMSRWHPFIMLLQLGENFACRNADIVISMLPKADSHLRNQGMAQKKFNYIPNGIELLEHKAMKTIPEFHMKVLSALKQGNQFICGYAGMHGIANALDTFILSINYLKNTDIVLVLVGAGPEKNSLKTLSEKTNSNKIIFLDPIPKDSMPCLLSLFDACFIAAQKSSLYRFGVSPNKLIDYMAAGRPVIQAIEAGNDLVAEAGCGISIPPEDPTAVAEAIRQLSLLSPAARAEMGERGQRYVLAHHDYEILAERFLKVLETDNGATT